MPTRTTRRPANRRLRRQTSADYLLEVTTKSTSARRRRRRRITGWIFKLLFVAVLGVASYHGAAAAFNRFFFENPDYTLHRIDFELDGIMTREEALAETGLRPGLNIFSVNLGSLEESLRAIPMVREVRIERELPDRLAITLRAREPVAWVAPPGEMGDPSTSPDAHLVDASGFLMRPRRVLPSHLALPAIYGVDADHIRDGEPLHSDDLRSALALLAELAARPDSLLRIRTMDISRGYRIEVLNDENARILFASSDFGDQLDRLQTLLLHCADTGRQLESVNLMVRRNTPVTFAMASPPDPEPSTAPQPSTSRRRN